MSSKPLAPSAPAHLTAEEICTRVRALGPLIEDQGDLVNEQGYLSDELKQGFVDAGAFRIGFPTSWGGPEMPLDLQIEMIEEIAYHDASVAWNVMILADSGFYASVLDEATARSLYPSMDLATAGSFRPAGRADVVEKGLRLNGRWSFGSGVRNSDRVLGGFHKYVDDEIVLNEQGKPELFICWMPRDEIEIYDVWYTTGLAGSGSTDYSIADVVVPESWMFQYGVADGDLSLPPLARHGFLIALNGAAVPLGIARRAIDELLKIIERPTRMDVTQTMRDQDPFVPAAVARARALHGAAWSHAMTTAREASDVIFSGRALPPAQHAALTQMTWVVGRLCRESLEAVQEVLGARSVLAALPFDRLRRDMETLIRHTIHRDKVLELAGRIELGLPIGSHLAG